MGFCGMAQQGRSRIVAIRDLIRLLSFVVGAWFLSRGQARAQVVAMEKPKAVVLLHNWLHGFSFFKG